MANCLFAPHRHEDDKDVPTPSRVRLPQYVYYVDCPEDDTVRVALRPEVRRLKDGQLGVFWWDPSYPLPDRMRVAKSVRKVGDGIEFDEAEETQRRYRLLPMTLELYREKVRDTIPSRPDFETLEELVEAYRATNMSW